MREFGFFQSMKIEVRKYTRRCPEAEFLDEIQTKVFRVFLLAIHSQLYTLQLCLEISVSSNSRNLLQFLELLYTVKEKGS
jgi:hypothetical protein